MMHLDEGVSRSKMPSIQSIRNNADISEKSWKKTTKRISNMSQPLPFLHCKNAIRKTNMPSGHTSSSQGNPKIGKNLQSVDFFRNQHLNNTNQMARQTAMWDPTFTSLGTLLRGADTSHTSDTLDQEILRPEAINREYLFL